MKSPHYLLRIGGIITAILVIAGIFPSISHAYSVEKLNTPPQGDFVLEPGKVDVALDPGQVYTKDIMVTNRNDHPVTFKVEVEDFVGTSDPNTPVVLLGNDKSPYSFKDNISPEVSTFTLDAGDRATIPITLTVPKDAQPGGYYSSVLISNEPSNADNATSTDTVPTTKIISRLGVLFFIRVNGDALEQGNLSDFRISPSQWLYQKGPFDFQILFNNDGNVHLVPYGDVVIKNMMGTVIDDIPVDAYFSLPHTTRYREITWDKSLLIGRYTATVTLHRGYGDMVDTKTIAFWVIPWKILISVIVIIVLILSGFYYIFSRFEFRKKK